MLISTYLFIFAQPLRFAYDVLIHHDVGLNSINRSALTSRNAVPIGAPAGLRSNSPVGNEGCTHDDTDEKTPIDVLLGFHLKWTYYENHTFPGIWGVVFGLWCTQSIDTTHIQKYFE